MPRGGARNRSGPGADPESGRSDQRGYKLTALPALGFDGAVPDWPLAQEPSDRELSVWQYAWRTPQACAWSMPSESWRIRSVAMWCRVSARAEDPDCPASVLAQLHRFADQIGMTTAGLAEMGWKVAVDEVAAKAADRAAAEPQRQASSRDRMKAVAGGAG